MIKSVIKNIESTVNSDTDPGIVLDRVVEILKDAVPHYDWVGFYLVDNGKLKLGPYRGKPSPHKVIEFGEGICGAAVREKSTLIVDDVNSDPRYLACSIETKSEIVVPMLKNGEVIGEIEVDSHTPAAFTNEDQKLLEETAQIVTKLF